MIKRTQSTHCIKKIDEEENTFYMKTHKVNTFYIGENTLGEHILQTRNHTFIVGCYSSACLRMHTTEHSIHT